MVALQHKYGIKSFNAVAHSMGNLGLMTYEMTYGQDKSLPKLRKQVSVQVTSMGLLALISKFPIIIWTAKQSLKRQCRTMIGCWPAKIIIKNQVDVEHLR